MGNDNMHGRELGGYGGLPNELKKVLQQGDYDLQDDAYKVQERHQEFQKPKKNKRKGNKYCKQQQNEKVADEPKEVRKQQQQELQEFEIKKQKTKIYNPQNIKARIKRQEKKKQRKKQEQQMKTKAQERQEKRKAKREEKQLQRALKEKEKQAKREERERLKEEKRKQKEQYKLQRQKIKQSRLQQRSKIRQARKKKLAFFQKKQQNQEPEEKIVDIIHTEKGVQEITYHKHKLIMTNTGPLTQHQISKLPFGVHSGQSIQCDICLTDIEEQDHQIYLFCMHIYHADCIVDWLKRSSQCPLCQVDMRQQIQLHQN